MSFTSIALRAAKKPVGTRTRAFHTPFALLGTSPLSASTSTSTNTNAMNDLAYQYEKQYYEHPNEPIRSSTTGYRTYVVSEPDVRERHYEVPAGAYPTSSPFLQFASAPAPAEVGGAGYSSTGGELLAHGVTTRRASQHPGGVGESSAVRFRSAPGEMGVRGGGYGGQGVVDREGTVQGEGSLGERNMQPDDQRVAGKFSEAGVDGAWKLRK